MNRKTKFRLLSVALMAALACHIHAESHLIDLNTGSTFDGVVSTKPLCTVTQDVDGITVSYQFDYAYLSENIDGDNIYEWVAEGLIPCSNPGEPHIVAARDIFNITDYKDVNVEIIGSTYIDLPFALEPTPYPIFGSGIQQETPDIVPYTGFFPDNILTHTDSYNVKDGCYIDVDLCAIQYNYSEKKIRAYKNVTYKITPKTGGLMKQRVASYSNESLWLDEGMENIISNPNSMPTTYATESTSSDLGLLVVTSRTLQNVVVQYVDYKRSLGIKTHLIVLNNGGNTAKEDVKDLIKSKLEEDQSIFYLLIVGDLSHVPTYNTNSNALSGYTTPMTDFNYGAENNVATAKHARIPVATETEAQIVFDKIKRYELTPPTNGKFYENVFIGSKFERDPDKPQYEYSGYRLVEVAQYVHNALKSLYGKDTTRYYDIELYDENGTAYPEPKYYCSLYNDDNEVLRPIPDSELCSHSFYNTDYSKNRIENLINSSNGYSCFFYGAHGDVDRFVTGDFSYTDVEKLTNGDRLPVILAASCLLGKYNENNNIAKALLKKIGGGCVGMIAATRVSYASTSTIFTHGLFDCIYPGVSDPLFTGEIENVSRSLRMGYVMDYANKIVRKNTAQPLMRIANDHAKMYHYFGDPTMRIRTKYPTVINQPVVLVKKDAFSGYKLTLLSENGQEYSICEEGQQPIRSLNGFVDMTITNPAKVNYTICINGDNKIPYYRTLTSSDVQAISYKMNATYKTSLRAISISYTPPTYIGSERVSTVRIDAYDSTGRFIGSTPTIVPNGSSYEHSISVPSITFKAPYLICMMVNGKCIYSIKIS